MFKNKKKLIGDEKNKILLKILFIKSLLNLIVK